MSCHAVPIGVKMGINFNVDYGQSSYTATLTTALPSPVPFNMSTNA
jgi:hypothetical protein